MAGTSSATVAAPDDQGSVTADGELRPGCRCQCRCVPATDAFGAGIVAFAGGSPFGAGSGGGELPAAPSPGGLFEDLARGRWTLPGGEAPGPSGGGGEPTVTGDQPFRWRLPTPDPGEPQEPPDGGGGDSTPPSGGGGGGGESPARPGDVLGPGGGAPPSDPYHPPSPPDGQPDPQAGQMSLYGAVLSAAAPPPSPAKPPRPPQYPTGQPDAGPPRPSLLAPWPVATFALPALRADAAPPPPSGPAAALPSPVPSPSRRSITGGGAPAAEGTTLGPFPFPFVYLPPDVAGLQETSLPPRRPVAPPHAGRFHLGGSDAPADSGIGARPHPVPGYDGVRKWRPSDEAAKRAPFSDLDAHRPVVPARAPSQGIYGDLGPGEPPAAEALLRPFLAPAAVAEPEAEEVRPPPHPAPVVLANRAAIAERLRKALPGTARGLIGSWAGGAEALPTVPAAFPAPTGALVRAVPVSRGTTPVLAPGPSAAEAHRPPAGPWGWGQIHREPPPMEGVAAEDAAGEAAPAPSPALDPVQALKEQIRAQVGQAQGRVPKPEMPGAPGGQRGKGGGLGALEGARGGYEAAEAGFLQAKGDLRMLEQLAETVRGDPSLDPLLRQARAAYDQAYDQYGQATEAYEGARKAAGSQAEKRLADQVRHQQEREAKKRAITPNYDQWKAGKDAQVGARSSRDQATSIDARAGQLRGKAEPETLRAVKETTKEAKKAAKEAKAAAKKAKDAARFGTKAEAEAAAKAAQDAARYAEQLATDAATILAQAEREALGEGKGAAGQDGGAEGPEDGSGTGGPSPSTAVPHGHETESDPRCGDPLVVCAAIEISCDPNEVRKCVVVGPQGPGGGTGAEGDGRDEAPGGVKGRGMPQQPGDTVVQPHDGPSPLSPEASGVDPETEDGGDGSAEAEVTPDSAATDSAGNEYVSLTEENVKIFPGTGDILVKHFGEWLLLPAGVVRLIIEPGSDPLYIDMARFEDSILAAARTKVMTDRGLESFDGTFSEFDERYAPDVEAARSSMLERFRVDEKDVDLAIPLKQAFEATKKSAAEFAESAWDIASLVPGLETVVDIIDLAAGLATGDLAKAGFAAAGLLLPVSGRAARKLTETIIEVGKRLDIAPGSSLRRRLLKGVREGVVELLFDEKLGRRLRLDEVQAHHVLPEKFKKEFAALGIDNRRYAAWWETKDHQRLAWQYNEVAERMLEAVARASNDSDRLKLVTDFVEKQAREHALTVYVLGG